MMCAEIMVFAEDPVHVISTVSFQHHAKTLNIIKAFTVLLYMLWDSIQFLFKPHAQFTAHAVILPSYQ